MVVFVAQGMGHSVQVLDDELVGDISALLRSRSNFLVEIRFRSGDSQVVGLVLRSAPSRRVPASLQSSRACRVPILELLKR